MNLNNKVIAITGGGQGLGRSMATLLASKGARLALIDLNQEKLNETAQLCKDAGGDAKAYIANVANEEQVVAAFATIASDFGQLDGLINNAGILRDGMLIKAKDGKVEKKLSLAEWQAVIDVNLTGVFLCGREAAEQMIKTGSKGVIINISSISRAGNVGQTNYSAAKAGVAAMTVTWAKELARYGIRSAAVAPGFIATDMVASMKPEALEKFTSVIPAKRLGAPEEIAATCLYIFETDYVNGRVIEMDGGLRL
ncbi:SDR family oxidoreductase [Dasania sp. GY-MA-18]|uniref:SDR family oxidoreductase n=1 Tax=Dasania phycosphaerae TaxID=2950436 RepID=A0A9J6RMX5_9GAMM|nr:MULTISPECIES: SDR family oxidoreductase [Dasania]MCR8923644.1 SDR family oxidoreductase [Dasania sp. GY-MA-18]MCZ0866078.1 SDR family oxidoreductase [Dasania phycosphaerae]MCZ0869802.1 SDR family oxidoreductase [Dasania phycosphaerae]